MAGHRTLTIIKPDAVGAQQAGRIFALLEAQGLVLMAARVMNMSRDDAGKLYEVHRERGFFDELVEFKTSGPCVPMVLEKGDAVASPALRSARPIRRRPLKGPSGSCSRNRRGGTRFTLPTRMRTLLSSPTSFFPG